MPFLSPAKVLVILVVVLVVLGPDKLPRVARQIGGLWGDFRKLRQRLESEVRGTFPEMPSTEKITQVVRSPISFLDTLADEHASERAADTNGNGAEPPDLDGSGSRASPGTDRPGTDLPEADPSPGGSAGIAPSAPEHSVVHQVRRTGPVLPDDPGMN